MPKLLPSGGRLLGEEEIAQVEQDVCNIQMEEDRAISLFVPSKMA